ncbi:MAG: hypothetical protein EWM73_01784 [Nitrospira sp.]|nr:MAG: hypothetical protein EWM73_01784 [Nitrospira sp.]
MIEPKRHDVVGLSPLPGSVVHNAEGRCAPHRISLRLTISVKKIDLLLTDIQDQVEELQRQMANLRLVRTQLASCQQEHGGEEGRGPYIHATLIDVRSDL